MRSELRREGDTDIERVPFGAALMDDTAGCVVVVRPDQYIAQVLPIDGDAELAAYFDGFMLPQSEWGRAALSDTAMAV